MRALTVKAQQARSVRVEEVCEPEPAEGDLLVRGVAVGVCGTDKEIARGEYGWSPPDSERLVIGHESLGRVERAPEGSGFEPGDLVVGVVRRPDPQPCGACARGEWDMCRNGQYTERGIKQLHGYASELWTVPAEFAVKVEAHLGVTGVLTEPTSVVANQVTDGPKPALVRDLGANYHTTSIDEVAARTRPDVVIEATGVGSLVFDAILGTGCYGIVCLTGVSARGRRLEVDARRINREIVLENDAVVGSVNANLRHYEQAAQALLRAETDWLQRLITARVPLAQAPEAFNRPSGQDVKVVITLDEEAA